MKRKIPFLTCTLSLLIALTTFTYENTDHQAYAHGGHDHGPSEIQGTQGGILMEAHHFYLEVVGSRSEIKIYPQELETGVGTGVGTVEGSKKLKSVPLDKVTISATYQLPKQKSSKKISLKPMNNYFSGAVEINESHRYQLDVQIEYGKVKEHFTYQIEP